MLASKQFSAGFGHSYIVPVPKLKDCITKALTCEDSRRIAISWGSLKVIENYPIQSGTHEIIRILFEGEIHRISPD